MSRSAAEKISLLERTLARVQKIAAMPRARALAPVAAPAVTVVSKEAETQPPAPPPVAAVSPTPPPVAAVSPAPPPVAAVTTPSPAAVVAKAPTVPPAAASPVPPLAADKAKTVPPAAAESPAPPIVEARAVVPPPVPTSELDVLDEVDVVPASQRHTAATADELEELPEHAPVHAEVVAREGAPRSVRPELPAESIVEVASPPAPAVERMSTRPPPALSASSRPPSSQPEDLEAEVPQRPQPQVPSQAQLGSIIELEEGPSQPLELAPAVDKKTPPPPPPEEEEVLPAAQAPGRFSGEMTAVRPPVVEAAPTFQDAPTVDRPTPLPAEPVERRSEPPAAPPRPRGSVPPPGAVRLAVPSSPPLYQPPRSAPPPAPLTVEVAAEVVRRSASADAPVSRFVEASQKAAPKTFGELLDDTLSLGS